MKWRGIERVLTGSTVFLRICGVTWLQVRSAAAMAMAPGSDLRPMLPA